MLPSHARHTVGIGLHEWCTRQGGTGQYVDLMHGILLAVIKYHMSQRPAVCCMSGLLSALCHLMHFTAVTADHILSSMLGSNCGFNVLRHGGAQIVHMDIKSVNVLLQDKTCRVAKIADLGISKYLVKGSLLDYTYRGMEACDCMSASL